VTTRESILAEVDATGRVFREWNVADIIGAYMQANGDDPALFVRPGSDWFHMNAAAYDPRDDSLIISSRESFLMKVDYATRQIKWVFGDPTKYWYTFPSLRAKSLAFSGGLYPVGQHGLSITPSGQVMVFNNGHLSSSQPAGAPRGEERSFSALSIYDIDEPHASVRQAASFDYGQSLKSDFCGSAYNLNGSVLMTYSQADVGTHMRLVGLDPELNVAFDLEFPQSGCNSGWNAMPIGLEKLILQ
jgi:hypothetical protein